MEQRVQCKIQTRIIVVDEKQVKQQTNSTCLLSAYVS